MLDVTEKPRVNGLDLAALDDTVAAVSADPSKGVVEFRVTTTWKGQTRSESVVDGYTLGGEPVTRNFRIAADEPFELLGSNGAPNPQELLMSAVNACMTVGYVANAAIRGITLDRLEIETHGELDLRGFLGLSDDVPPGYRRLDYTVRIGGDGSPEQFEEIHQAVARTSPNYFNMASPIAMHGRLELR
jgi:uncharacterized OsmC-like protein